MSEPAKTCTKCGETKALESFYVCRRNRDGRRADCRRCFLERVKQRQARARGRWLWMADYR